MLIFNRFLVCGISPDRRTINPRLKVLGVSLNWPCSAWLYARVRANESEIKPLRTFRCLRPSIPSRLDGVNVAATIRPQATSGYVPIHGFRAFPLTFPGPCAEGAPRSRERHPAFKQYTPGTGQIATNRANFSERLLAPFDQLGTPIAMPTSSYSMVIM